MDVKLISYTPEPEKVVAAAARLCYSPRSAVDIMEDFSEEQVQKFLDKLTEMGHDSPLEHASFTFAIDGVSRALSHQLVRHRIGVSFSQKSQRYVTEKNFSCHLPPTVAADSQAVQIFQNSIAQIGEAYEALLQLGIPAEDARYLLPNAATTNLVVTMNARSLYHFFRLRCCVRAQAEIRELAYKMLAEVKAVAPHLFAKAGASCDTHGICFEGAMSCGKAPTV